MKSAKIGFFPILGNYRQEHLRRIERRYLSESVNLPLEIQEKRPVLCTDGEDFIRTKFPNFPAIYQDSAVNQELLDELTSVKSIQDMISRLEVEESSAKSEQFLNDPRSIALAEDIEEMMPPNPFDDFEQFRKDVPDLDDVEMVLDTELAEEESAQLVVLPECYKKDLFDENKTHRMLTNILDWEETKKKCIEMMGDSVPSINDLMRQNFKNSTDDDHPIKRRNLEKDLEDIFNCEKEVDVLALPEKIELEMDLEAILESETEVLKGSLQNTIEALVLNDLASNIETIENRSRSADVDSTLSSNDTLNVSEDLIANLVEAAIEEDTQTMEIKNSNSSKPPRPVTPYANDDPEENDYSVKESVSTASTYIENDISAKKPEVPQVLESSRNSQVTVSPKPQRCYSFKPPIIDRIESKSYSHDLKNANSIAVSQDVDKGSVKNSGTLSLVSSAETLPLEKKLPNYSPIDDKVLATNVNFKQPMDDSIKKSGALPMKSVTLAKESETLLPVEMDKISPPKNQYFKPPMVDRVKHKSYAYDSKKTGISKKKEMMAVTLPKKLNLALLKKRFPTPQPPPPLSSSSQNQVSKSKIPSQRGDIDADVVKVTKFHNNVPKFANSNATGGKKLYEVSTSSTIASSFYSSSVEELSKINFPPSKSAFSKPISNITPIKKHVPTPYSFGGGRGENTKEGFKKKPHTGHFNHTRPDETPSTTAFRTLKALGTGMNTPSPSPYNIGRSSKNNEENFGSQKSLDHLFKTGNNLESVINSGLFSKSGEKNEENDFTKKFGLKKKPVKFSAFKMF